VRLICSSCWYTIYLFSEEDGSVHDENSMLMLSKEGLIRKQLIYPQLFHQQCGRQSMKCSPQNNAKQRRMKRLCTRNLWAALFISQTYQTWQWHLPPVGILSEGF